MRAAIVLAAGRSRRFGRADKLFAALGRVPLLLYAIRIARAAPVGRVIVVTGRGTARASRVIRAAELRNVHVVRVRGNDAPMSASLRAGLAALAPIERDAFVFLGDMPGVDPALAARLVRGLRPGVAVVRPRHGGIPGHPVLIRGARAAHVATGDAGLRGQDGAVGWIEAGPGCIGDVDRRADLSRIRRKAR